jgi:aryl-alcohol dehydrogenase-like predicted oxidoreductase
LRFVLGAPDVSTVLVGVATVDQLDAAIATAEAGRLPPEAMELVDGAWLSMAGGSPA